MLIRQTAVSGFHRVFIFVTDQWVVAECLQTWLLWLLLICSLPKKSQWGFQCSIISLQLISPSNSQQPQATTHHPVVTKLLEVANWSLALCDWNLRKYLPVFIHSSPDHLLLECKINPNNCFSYFKLYENISQTFPPPIHVLLYLLHL